jgi:hypothetical protein
MARSPTDYLSDDWGMTPPGGTNASGVDETPNYEDGNPFRAKMPEHPEWGLGKEGGTSFGHSDDVKDTGTKSSAWGMSKDDQAKGYERGEADGEGPVLGPRQVDGSFPQSIPDSNPHDRGAGSDAYAREHSATTGRGFDGRGQPKSTSNPGGQSIGSRENLG